MFDLDSAPCVSVAWNQGLFSRQTRLFCFQSSVPTFTIRAKFSEILVTGRLLFRVLERTNPHFLVCNSVFLAFGPGLFVFESAFSSVFFGFEATVTFDLVGCSC